MVANVKPRPSRPDISRSRQLLRWLAASIMWWAIYFLIIHPLLYMTNVEDCCVDESPSSISFRNGLRIWAYIIMAIPITFPLIYRAFNRICQPSNLTRNLARMRIRRIMRIVPGGILLAIVFPIAHWLVNKYLFVLYHLACHENLLMGLPASDRCPISVAELWLTFIMPLILAFTIATAIYRPNSLRMALAVGVVGLLISILWPLPFYPSMARFLTHGLLVMKYAPAFLLGPCAGRWIAGLWVELYRKTFSFFNG